MHAFPERDAAAGDIEALVGSRIIQVKQVHGGQAVDASTVTPDTEADALIARAGARGGWAAPTAVGVRVADCVPILVADTESGDVAAIHAGWRGVVAGVVASALHRLSGTTLVAAVGPCIGPCCFEVGADVAQAIARAAPGANVVLRHEGDKAFVDLRAAVRSQLVDAAGSRIQVEDVSGCTKHEATRFHSYRRDGARSGRMLAVVSSRGVS